ncbi:MAG: EAL domain-containing protein [Lysobacter sp.]|nr:EAL domain-containing protein [Lysobacter sp.]MDQ3270155.1 EAL domain-containing protein [Pseudomonadota bacterium]
MRLSAFLTAHMTQILAEWDAFARTLGPVADAMSDLALRDHARAMLEAMATDMESAAGDAAPCGLAASDPPGAASIHGAFRQSSGFSLPQLTAEFFALRATVLRLWLPAIADVSAARSRDILRFNLTIDQALSESIVAYAEHAALARDVFLEADRQASVLNALPANIALVDLRGRIISVNKSWREFATPHLLQGPGCGLGLNYLDVCDGAQGEHAMQAHEVGEGIRAILSGQARSFTIEYPCPGQAQEHWFQLTAAPLIDAEGAAGGAVVMHQDVTERRHAQQALWESEQRFSGAFEHAPSGMALVAPDGRWLKVNRAMCEILGYSESELLARTFQAITYPEDLARDLDHLHAMVAGDTDAYRMEKRYIHKCGHIVHVLLSVSVVRDDARRPRYFISHVQDINERKQAEAKSLQLAEKLATTLDSITDALFTVDADWRFTFLNTEAERLLAQPAEDLLERDIWSAFPRMIGSPMELEYRKAMADQTASTFEEFFPPLDKWFHGRVFPSDRGLTVYFRDVTQTREAAETLRVREERLDYLAYYDEVTGLANRALFMDRAAQHMRNAAMGEHRLAIFVMDLERFKNINDSFGHACGDALLKQVAQWLADRGGAPSLLTRVGADHFAAVLPRVNPGGDLPRLIEQALEALANHPFVVGDAVLRVALKVGVALFPGDGDSAETLFQHAEAALKQAKALGDRYLFYSSSMSATVASKLTLENQLRRAIDNEEFVLHYQPKLDLVSGLVGGAEALIRWNHPHSGLVPPGDFIPILEETGLIHEVGRWALHKAMQDRLCWLNAGFSAMRISVNVSALQLRDRGFVADIEDALGLDSRAAAGLELEITESMIMLDIERGIASLRAIREMGVSVALDDFGTGFSSLSYLARLPIDALKVDRSFISDMTVTRSGRAIVTTIINLAHALDYRVVAEGVETQEQSWLLRVLGCDEMQGYFFGRPVPFAVFQAMYMAPGVSIQGVDPGAVPSTG